MLSSSLPFSAEYAENAINSAMLHRVSMLLLAGAVAGPGAVQ